MSLFRVSRGAHAQSVSADSITLDVPAGRVLFVHQAEITGMASAVAAGAEIGLFRVSTLGSGGTPTSLVVKPVNPNDSVPSGLTAKYGYGTQPVVEADPVWRGGYQPLGGKARYTALPGGALMFWSSSAYQVSLRGISGTPSIQVDALEIEIL